MRRILNPLISPLSKPQSTPHNNPFPKNSTAAVTTMNTSFPERQIAEIKEKTNNQIHIPSDLLYLRVPLVSPPNATTDTITETQYQ